MIDLTGGPCIYKRISGCGSGTEYMAVTPWGELYPCHQFVGDPKYSLGNIYEGVTNTAIQDEFKLCNAYARPNCKDCWAKLIAAAAVLQTRTMLQAQLQAFMNMAVSCLKSVWNVQL